MVDDSRVVYDSNDVNVITSIGKTTDGQQKRVMLTFDDGPSRLLPQILDILHEENINALFFWQTRLLYQERPWERLLNEGHLIGTHTCKHPNLSKCSYEEQYNELSNSKRKIESITSTEVKYFRPPFGQYNSDTIEVVHQLGLVPVMWKIASMDWELKENPEKIITNVVEHLEDGAIILLHELRQTLIVLPEMIREIRNRGYSIVLFN